VRDLHSPMYRAWAPPLIMCVLLVAVSLSNYVLFHTLAEGFAVVVAVLMAATAWYTYPHSRDSFLMFLGCGYFWVGATDLAHALVYLDIDVFAAASLDATAQYWLGARFLEAFVLLAAPLFLDRPLRRWPVFAAFGAVFALIAAAIDSGWFPTAYVPSVGLTPFKVAGEYVIIAILLAAAVHLHARAGRLTRRNYGLIMASIGLTIVAELFFTAYVSVFDAANAIGHLFKLLSFWILFHAIIRSTLEEPYRRLEQLVAERGAALSEREGRLRLVVEAAALGEIEVDYARGTVAASPRAREIFGLKGDGPFTVEEVRALCHPEDRERVRRVVEEAIASRRPRMQMEFRVVRPGGATRWVEFVGGKAEFDAPEDVRAVGILQDISGRKRAEAALRESEERFRQFAENINAVVWIADSQSRRLEYLGARYEEVFGEPPERLRANVGRWVRLVHPEDRPLVRAAARRLRSQSGYEVEFRIIRPADGTIRWIRDTGFAIADAGGEVRRVAGIARDVTEWKQIGEALRESEEMFRALFRLSPVAITISGMEDGRIVEANDAWLKMMGYERAEAVGRTAEELRIWAEAGHHAPLQGPPAEGEPLSGIQEVARRRDGTPIVLLSFHQQIAFLGRPHAVTIALDITERTEAEQRQRILMREVDHRAKNALAVVHALVRLTKADTVEAFVEAVQGRIGALAQVHSLLAKSRWNGADLEALIEAELKPFLGDRRARTCLSGPPVRLATDAVQPLGMVFHELATNAAKYGALSVAAGTVTLTWSQDADGDLGLVWQEAGGPPAREPPRRGFGSKMIVATVCEQLAGTVEFLWRESGLVCRITVDGGRIGHEGDDDRSLPPSPAMEAAGPRAGAIGAPFQAE